MIETTVPEFWSMCANVVKVHPMVVCLIVRAPVLIEFLHDSVFLVWVGHSWHEPPPPGDLGLGAGVEADVLLGGGPPAGDQVLPQVVPRQRVYSHPAGIHCYNCSGDVSRVLCCITVYINSVINTQYAEKLETLSHFEKWSEVKLIKISVFLNILCCVLIKHKYWCR